MDDYFIILAYSMVNIKYNNTFYCLSYCRVTVVIYKWNLLLYVVFALLLPWSRTICNNNKLCTCSAEQV